MTPLIIDAATSRGYAGSMVETVPLVSALSAELAEIERELRKDARYRRALLIRDLLESYGASSVPTESGRRPHPGGDGDDAGDPVRKEIADFLRTNGLSHKKVILKHLQARGHLTDVQNASKALGKRLWRMREVKSDGRGSYSLNSS